MGKIIMDLETPPLVTRDESSSSAFGKTAGPLHQPTTTSSSRSSSRRRKVSFGSDDNHVKVVVHSYSYCDDDDDNNNDTNEASNDDATDCSDATWYSNQEFQEIRDETYAKIKLYRHRYFHDDEDDEDDDWTWRGFEYVISRHPRKQLRREHVMNVVYFQKVLGTMTETSVVALADYASNMTFANGSALRARSLAMRDEMETCSSQTDEESFSSSCSSLVVVEDAPKTVPPMSASPLGKQSQSSHQRRSSTHSHSSTTEGPASPWIKMRQFFRCA